MNITSAEVKNLAFKVVSYEPEVDEKGQLVPIKTYPFKHLRGMKEIKTKVLTSLEILTVPKEAKKEELKESDYVWMSIDEMNKDLERKPFGENGQMAQRLKEGEIAFSSAAEAALKYYLDLNKDNFPDMHEDCLKEVEALMGVKC